MEAMEVDQLLMDEFRNMDGISARVESVRRGDHQKVLMRKNNKRRGKRAGEMSTKTKESEFVARDTLYL